MILRKTLKKSTGILLSFTMLFAGQLPSVSPVSAAASGGDYVRHWAEKEIRNWTDLELVNGYEDGSFKPDASITRAEFVVLVNRAFGLTQKAASGFSDVKPSDWYSDEVSAAKAAGYINGYEDGSFKPNQPVSRQEVAVMLQGLLKLSASDQSGLAFQDTADIPGWSREAVRTVAALGYMGGYPDRTYQPARSITRAEAVMTLNRANPLASKTASYDQAGTYNGRAEGHVIVRSAGVKLENMAIDGDLILSEGIGEGNTDLKNVTVKGRTIVRGGGPNSIVIEDSKLGQVTVSKANGQVRLLAKGTTTVGEVRLNSGAKLETNGSSGATFGKVDLTPRMPAGSTATLAGTFDEVSVNASNVTIIFVNGNLKAFTVREQGKGSSLNVQGGTANALTLDAAANVTLNGGVVEQLKVNEKADNSSIQVGEQATVKTLTLNAASTVKGSGTIEKAIVNKNGSTFEKEPKKLELAANVETKVGGKKITGSNGAGSPVGGGSSGSGSSDDEVVRPAPPAGLTLSTGMYGLTARWKATADSKVTGYSVSLFTKDGKQVGSEATTRNSYYSFIGLEKGTAYRVSVSAIGSNGTKSEPAALETTTLASGNIPVQLLSINDLHGKIDQTYYEKNVPTLANPSVTESTYVGRMDYVAAYMKQRREAQPNTLLVESGDLWGGSSPVSALLQDEPTIEVAETMGFHVGTVGNHEFDEGTAEMLRMVNGGTHPKGTENYKGTNFPLLAANIVYKDTGKTVLPPYAVVEVAGVKVGFIGVVTTSAAGMVMPAGIQDIQFTDEAQAVNKAAAELKSQGVKAMVVLAHMDATQGANGTVTGASATLAKNIDPEVDVIVAAHNHVIVNGMVNNKLIVQAWEYGKALADIDLEIDPVTQDIVSKKAEIVYTRQDAIQPDAEISNIIKKYENRIAPMINEVVGNATIPMTGGYANDGDNALGNLLADGMRWSMNADFAMMNGGGIRDNLNAGPITWGELFNIQPFNNVLMKVEIKGKDLDAIVNAQISSTFGPDYSISGFRYEYDAATGKITKKTLPDGSPIDNNKTYTLVVNNFMYTSTGAKYAPIGQLGKNPVTGPEDLEATVAFVRNYKGDIAYVRDGRISKAKAPEPGPDLGKVTIRQARGAADNSKVTIEGVATSKSGIWGSKGFYLQDATGGMYIFQSGIELNPGDHVTVTGLIGKYNGELQVNADKNGVVKSATEAVPSPLNVTPAQVGPANAGQLVKLSSVTIANLTKINDYGTFEFDAVKASEQVRVRVDNRIGLTYDQFRYRNGDTVDVIGASSRFNESAQVKVKDSADITVPGGMTITDLVYGAKTSTSVTLHFTAPAGAASVKMMQSANGGAAWTEADTQGTLGASSVTATVYGLIPGTAYKFKLNVTGGPYNGDSNAVDVITANASGWNIEKLDGIGAPSSSYASGTVAGMNSIAWNYVSARTDLSTYVIDGKGIMLKAERTGSGAAAAGEIGASNIPGGIGSFSVKLLKGFTGAGERKVELFINNVSKGTYTLTLDTVETFTVNNLNIPGSFDLKLKHVGAPTNGANGAQITVDDISWTGYSG
nr:S-layer homology domain-containing protein [Paenibacillus elgii]